MTTPAFAVGSCPYTAGMGDGMLPVVTVAKQPHRGATNIRTLQVKGLPWHRSHHEVITAWDIYRVIETIVNAWGSSGKNPQIATSLRMLPMAPSGAQETMRLVLDMDDTSAFMDPSEWKTDTYAHGVGTEKARAIAAKLAFAVGSNVWAFARTRDKREPIQSFDIIVTFPCNHTHINIKKCHVAVLGLMWTGADVHLMQQVMHARIHTDKAQANPGIHPMCLRLSGSTKLGGPTGDPEKDFVHAPIWKNDGDGRVPRIRGVWGFRYGNKTVTPVRVMMNEPVVDTTHDGSITEPMALRWVIEQTCMMVTRVDPRHDEMEYAVEPNVTVDMDMYRRLLIKIPNPSDPKTLPGLANNYQKDPDLDLSASRVIKPVRVPVRITCPEELIRVGKFMFRLAVIMAEGHMDSKMREFSHEIKNPRAVFFPTKTRPTTVVYFGGYGEPSCGGLCPNRHGPEHRHQNSKHGFVIAIEEDTVVGMCGTAGPNSDKRYKGSCFRFCVSRLFTELEPTLANACRATYKATEDACVTRGEESFMAMHEESTQHKFMQWVKKTSLSFTSDDLHTHAAGKRKLKD